MEILEIIRQKKEELQQRFGIQRIGLVEAQGSSEPQGTNKVNLIIEFGEVTMDVFLELKSFLEALFRKDVDLATFEEPTPHIHPFAEKEISWWE